MKNFELIYFFITIPISRDPETISKILKGLIEDMGPKGIDFTKQSDMMYYERSMSEAHLEKLKLLS
jgi:hypothetical protein